ncbi:MAG: serine/threonine-protein kinase, partial [Gemmatimonadales bacterium]
MSDWAYCPKCATPLPPDATACPACGATTPSAPTEPSDGGAGPQQTDEDLRALEAALEKALSPSYILVRRIGTGGMGSVFLARDPALKRLVAVKVLAPALAANEAARARFEREAQAVARLSHPNIVAIHSVGQLDDGTPYFVMQHVGGKSLAARLAEEGPFSTDETRRIVGEVASALAAAHQQGIIHRDIKPANVLYDDETGRVLVSDFGIAAVRPVGEQPQQTKLTMTGMAVGTPRYMSPEQLLAEEVTEKTDVYALGLLGYELLTGVGPFQATSPQELIAAHLRDTPKPLSDAREDVDPELESAITR